MRVLLTFVDATSIVLDASTIAEENIPESNDELSACFDSTEKCFEPTPSVEGLVILDADACNFM